MEHEAQLGRFTRLAQVARALTADLETDEMLRLILHQGMTGMIATGGAVSFIQGDSLFVAAAMGTTREAMRRLGPVKLAQPNPACAVIHTGEPIWITEREDGIRRFPDLSLASATSQGWAILPLISRGRPFGGLSLSFITRPRFDDDDREFLVALADVAALALHDVFTRLGHSPQSLYLSMFLEELLADPSDAVVIVDGDGVILGSNQQLADLLGYGRGSLIGRSVDVLLPAGARDEHSLARRRYLDDPVPRPFGSGLATVAVHHNGHEVPVEISLSPVATPLGTCVVAVLRAS